MKKYRTKSGKVEEKLQGVNATVNPSEKAQIAMAGGADTLKDVQTILGQEGKRNNLKGQGAKHLVSFAYGDPDDDETGAANTFGGQEVGSNFGTMGATEGVFGASADPSVVAALGYGPESIEGRGPTGMAAGDSWAAQDAVKSAFLDASKKQKQKQKQEQRMRIAAGAVGLSSRAKAEAMPDPTMEELFSDEYGPKYKEAFALEPTPFSRDKARDKAREALTGVPTTLGEKGIDWNKTTAIAGGAKAGFDMSVGGIAAGLPGLIVAGLGYVIGEHSKDKATTTSSTSYTNGVPGKTIHTTYDTRALAAAKAAKDRPTTPDYSGGGDDAPKKKKKLIRSAANNTTLAVDDGDLTRKQLRSAQRQITRFA